MRIFISIHADYVSLHASSVLRDTEMALTRKSRRAEDRSGAERGEIKRKSAFVPRFLPNAANLNLQKVYNQMRERFEEMFKLKEE